MSSLIEDANGVYLQRLAEMAKEKKCKISKTQWEALFRIQPALASKMADANFVLDENSLALIGQESQRRCEQAAAEAKERAARRAAAIAAREAACIAAAAPAAVALRCALKDAMYRLPELERVLARLEELELPVSNVLDDMTTARPVGRGAMMARSAERSVATASSSELSAQPAHQALLHMATMRRWGGTSGREPPPPPSNLHHSHLHLHHQQQQQQQQQQTTMTTTKTKTKTTTAAATTWTAFGGSSSSGGGGGTSACAAELRAERLLEHSETAIFVHFIPPPLRQVSSSEFSSSAYYKLLTSSV